MLRARVLLTAAAGLIALALAACGDDDSTVAPGASQAPSATRPGAPAAGTVEVELSATEDGRKLAFSEESLQVAAGPVRLTLRNPESNRMPHAIAVLGGNGASRAGRTALAGSTSTVDVTLVPGDYTFFCPVGDHRARGMEGVLVVE